MIRRLALPAFALMLLLAGAPAVQAAPAASQAAADRLAECLWNGLPSALRDAYVADYPTKGPKALDVLSSVEDATGAKIMAACGIPNDNLSRVGHLLAAHGLKTGAGAVLKSRWNIDTARLDAAWAAIPLARRQPLIDAARTFAPLSDDQRAPIQDIYKQLAITDPDAQGQVTIYLMGEAVIAANTP
ncbi:MAG: hypothetical protein JWP35_2220 [Caulobacter sp.]|nr:hypothetical protein [Caulobacter sp.]